MKQYISHLLDIYYGSRQNIFKFLIKCIYDHILKHKILNKEFYFAIINSNFIITSSFSILYLYMLSIYDIRQTYSILRCPVK